MNCVNCVNCGAPPEGHRKCRYCGVERGRSSAPTLIVRQRFEAGDADKIALAFKRAAGFDGANAIVVGAGVEVSYLGVD